ncbi:transcription factor TFIIIB component B'' homolog isoform X3 [Anguilla rostrata]|uniref:transcription factor TFIIIB component B'' homolog isoform X3 n=1 Tax=Anguilla rostrata TaxID=7938 RepID=UPI0030CE61D9
MMRRSRISVRPNIARPGGRGLPGSQEGQHGQGAAAVDTTHAAGTEGKGADSAAVIDPGQPVEQSAETAAGLNTSQDTSPEKIIFPDLGEEDQNGGTPNDRPLMSTTPQRRKRFSAMPNLSKPRATPAPRTLKSPLPAAPSQPPPSKPAAPPTPAEPPDPVPEDQAAESSGAKQGVGSPGVGSPGVESPGLAVLGDQVTSQDQTGPVSPVAPTTSCSEPPSEKNKKRTRKSSGRQSVSPESKASSSQPVQSEPIPSYGKLSPINASPQEGPSTQHYPLKLVGPLEDRRRIAKARKLKEMMRLENRKEKSQRKSKPHEDDFSSPLDHSKMTMRDLIYYLPETNPMKSAVMEEQKQDEQFTPPFPSQELPPTKPEVEEEEDEEDDDGAMKDEDLLVPKVKVAEDGSLVIDEESLTVRVTRAQGPSIVEGNDPVFERGSTTTYTSFRNLKYSKPWSDKETDMFYLALSMVGSDFSMMCHLFPHRDRKEVKNKFKREEKTSSWRIDKAFREKRPFDMEFFSSLLELVLAADKRKRDKSKPKGSSGEKPKRKRKCKKASVKGGSEGQAAKDGELDCDVAEGNLETAEKENEDCSNVAKAEDSKKGTRKTRKRVKKSEGEEQEEEKPDSTENQEEEVKPKRRKKMANGKKASVKGASEGQATGDGELDADVAEGDMETAEKENEDCSKDSTKGTRKKRKRVKKSEEEEQAEEDPNSAEEQEVKVKKKRQKKMANGKKASLKGTDEDQLSPDVEVGDGVAEGDLEASEEKDEDGSNVTDATNTATATRKKCKRAKKGEEEEDQEEEEPDSTKEKADGRKKKQSEKNPDDGAILVNVTEKEVASAQSDAKEAVGSETMGSTVEGQLVEPVRVPSAEAEPSLVRGRSTENIPDSEEKTLDSSRREEEECRADDVSLFEISDCSALLEGVFAIDGSTLPLTDEESPEGDQQGAPDVSLTDGQKLINNSRVEGQESSSLPPPEATSPKGRGQLPETELWPRAGTHQESHPSSKLNMGERSEEEDHDEGGWEDTEVEEEEEKEVQDQVQVEEQGSPCHTEILSQEQVLVPLGLHSLELLSNELQIPAGVSDAPGPGASADAQRSVPGCERAEDECVELSEHHLNLLVDVIESLSPHLVGGMQAEDDDEVARTLLTLSNPDLQFPKTANALDPPNSAPVEEQEPESEQAGQSQCSGQAPQSVTSDLPVTSAPVDEVETCPVKEPVTSEEGESVATTGNVMPDSEPLCSDSLVQGSTPLGRRSRFPKPRLNLGLATRAPRTPLRGSTAPPCPGPVSCAAPPTVNTESPMPSEEERSDQNLITNKESASVQIEGEGSGKEKLLEPGALSTQSETLCSDSLVQSVPLVRRSRFPKPRPNLGRSTRAPHTAPSQNPATPKPVDDSSSTPLEGSSTLTPVQESPTCSSSDLSAEVIDQKALTEGSSETQNTEEERPTVETGAASSSFIAPLGPSQPCPGPSFTEPVPGTGGEETAEGAPASTGVPENELVLADEDASSSADESRQAAGIEAPGVCFDGDASAFITKECMEGLSWADGGEEEPTFILTLFAVPPLEIGDYQTGPEALGLATENPFSPPTSMIADPQSGPLPAISEPHCESLSVETAETGSGCDSVTHLVLSDALIPVCEEQEEGPAQHWTGLQELRPHTAPSQTAGEKSLTAVMNNDAEGLPELCEEDHGSQIVDSVAESHDPVAESHDPVIESHDPVKAGTDGMSERDKPSREKRKPPIRTRRGKLQVKPYVTQRKLRGSVRDEQGLLPEEAVQPGPSHTQPGPAHTSPQIHQPTATQADTQQEEPAAGSELLGVEELPQGNVGHSDLPQEELGLLAGAEDEESISGGVEPLLGCQSTQDSCESLSVETAEAGSGCGSVTHLVLSDAFIPVCEEQEEGPAQHWTGLQEQRPHTAFSQTAGETALTAVMVTACNNDAEGLAELCEEDHSSQTVDPAVESHDTAVESHDPVEAGTDGTSERDTPSQEKRKPPVRTRRGKLQVKPCVTQRKLRSSVRDEQGLLPEEAVQPGPSHTQTGPSHTESGSSYTPPGPSHTPPGPSHTQPDPAHTSSQTLPPTLPLPDTQQEDSAAASELPAAVELPQGTVGHSDLPQQEEGVAAGAEDEESCDGEEGHSTTQSTSATLTRSGRAPRGFLSFLSGGSGAGLASRPVRHVSQKPSVNTSRTGRRRTTADAVTEASAHNSPSSSSPTKVSESTCFSGPSAEPTNSQVSVPAEGEFLCARPSATEEEPTKVSEFYFQDIFTEVLESD